MRKTRVLGQAAPLPPGKAKTLASLPLRHGGFGIIPISRLAPAAWIASLAAAARFLQDSQFGLNDPAINQTAAQLRQAAPAVAELLPAVEDGEDYPLVFQQFFTECDEKGALRHDPTKLQQAITKPIHDALHKQLKIDFATPFDRCHLEAIERKLASAWILALPADNHTTLRDIELVVAARHRLDLPLLDSLPKFCGCGTVLANRDRSHLLTCKRQKGNGHIVRHNALVQIMQTAIIAAGGDARAEIKGLAVDAADRRRPDLEFEIDGYCSIADVAVIHPAAKSRQAQRKPADVAAKAKQDKYADMYGDGKEFSEIVPLIFEAYGGFGDAARHFVARLADAARANGRLYKRAAADIVGRVAVTLQRGNARSVLIAVRRAS